MIETPYKYRKMMFKETYLFRFEDNFLINLFFMPVKKIFSPTKIHYAWDKVVDIPIIILNVKNNKSYRFFVTYKEKRGNNIIVTAKYKNREIEIKYDSLIRGHYKKLILDNYHYKYDIGHNENGWEVFQHIKNKRGSKRYVLKDLTVEEDRFLEIDENKLLYRGFPKQKKRLKDINLYNIVVNKNDLDAFTGSSNKIKVLCFDCNKEIYSDCNSISQRIIRCTDCTKSISFPEKVMKAVLDYNKIGYRTEVKFKELGQMRVDFVVDAPNGIELIEVNGLQHYQKTHKWYKHSARADKKKTKFAAKYNIPIHFVDARKSDVDYILKSIDSLKIDYIEINKDDILNVLMRRKII